MNEYGFTTVGLHLRSAPVIGDNIITTLNARTLVTVHSRHGGWLNVSADNLGGYCAERYVDTSAYRIDTLEARVARLEALHGEEPKPPPQDDARVARAFHELNHVVVARESDEWRIKDVFYTLDGNWEVGEQDSPYAIEAWARKDYLYPTGHELYFDDAGADNHILALARDVDGTYMGDVFMTQVWPDGSASTSANRDGKKSGWVNWAIGHNVYYPDTGARGPFSVKLRGHETPVLHGIGLPYARHVSTFVAFQKKER